MEKTLYIEETGEIISYFEWPMNLFMILSNIFLDIIIAFFNLFKLFNLDSSIYNKIKNNVCTSISLIIY